MTWGTKVLRAPAPRAALLVLLAASAGCSGLLEGLAFHPRRLQESAPPPADPRVEEVSLESADGTRLHAYLVRSPGSSRVVLFLHGNAGHALDRLGDALTLSTLGTNVLLLSYRGYGKSDGSPSEDGVYEDARAALRYLQAELGIPRREVWILGRSIGSAVAVEVARDEPPRGLILVSPLTSGRDMACHLGLGWLAWLAGDPFDSLEKIQGIRSPLLVIHGSRDRLIPPEQGLRLLAASPASRKILHLVPGAGHNDLLEVAGPAYWRWIAEFLEASGDEPGDHRRTRS